MAVLVIVFIRSDIDYNQPGSVLYT